jgi:hypothetical protein
VTVTSQASAGAVRSGARLVARHAELQQVLDQWAAVLAAAADRGDPVRPAKTLLRTFLADEILPHARAEERTLYRASRCDPQAALLVEALVREHRDLAAQAGRLAAQVRPIAVAATAEAISVLFASHVAKENDLLLPALERSGANLARLIAREHRLSDLRSAA